MTKKLYRSEKDRKIAGVCGGLAEYFGIDPTIIRLAVAVLSCFWLTGVVLYIIAAIVIPTESEVQIGGNNNNPPKDSEE